MQDRFNKPATWNPPPQEDRLGYGACDGGVRLKLRSEGGVCPDRVNAEVAEEAFFEFDGSGEIVLFASAEDTRLSPCR